jgi:signal transduction histidine kinase
MKTFLFVMRIALAWSAGWLFAFLLWAIFTNRTIAWPVVLVFLLTIGWVKIRTFSHVRRVRLITDRIDAEALGSRHRRQIEIPFPADEAFTMIDAAIRELPYVESVESARDSLQVYARVRRMDPYTGGKQGRKPAQGASGAVRNLVRATVTPGERTGSLLLICEPESPGWVDFFMVDDGTNLENMEAVTRAISRRISERRKAEEAVVRETATGKELAVAKLSLLHAQVEPHFLYNTLASAQILTRQDPARADQMLGNLITYLRQSVPRTEDSMSTVGEELERARAYLEILRLRMGDRLALQIQVPDGLMGVPMPPMMLQTLVENAIKHGLEPVTGGGTIWILAREDQGKVAVTVADDGRGFGTETSGTGIGLRNVRERLKLAYGDAASFAIGANFPKGVAATITVPRSHPGPRPDAGPAAAAVPVPPTAPSPPPPRAGTPPWAWKA